jgi:ribosomal protein S27E
MLAQSTQRFMAVTGAISVCCGAYNAWSAYSAMLDLGNAAASGIAHAGTAVAGLAQSTTASLTQQTLLPRLLLSEPLIWIGVLLLIAPVVLRHLGTERRPSGSVPYAGFAYVECPHCHHPVRANETRCPHCGKTVDRLWGTEAGSPYLRRDPARR